MDGQAYSLDLRKRVVAAIKGGMSRNQAAKHFGVAISTAINWMQRVEERPAALLRARWAATRRRFRETTRSGCRSGSRAAISLYAGSLPSLPENNRNKAYRSWPRNMQVASRTAFASWCFSVSAG
jgi:hypothetical protein